MEVSRARALNASWCLVEKIERRQMLALLMGSWRRFTEDAQKSRRESFFDSMHEQMLRARSWKSRSDAWSERCEQVLEKLEMPWLLHNVISDWRSAVWITGNLQRDGNLSSQLPQRPHSLMTQSHIPPVVRSFSPRATASSSMPGSYAPVMSSSVSLPLQAAPGAACADSAGCAASASNQKSAATVRSGRRVFRSEGGGTCSRSEEAFASGARTLFLRH